MAKIIRCDVPGCGKDFTDIYGWVTYCLCRSLNSDDIVSHFDICPECLEKGKLEIRFVPNPEKPPNYPIEEGEASFRETILITPEAVDLPSVTTTATAEVELTDETIGERLGTFGSGSCIKGLVKRGIIVPVETQGQCIQRLRRESRMTQEQLTKAANLRDTTIKDIEAGKFEYLTACAALKDIARALRVDVSELLRG